MLDKRYLTPEEAEELMPKVRPLLLRLMKIHAAVQRSKGMIVKHRDRHRALAHELTYNKQLHTLMAELYGGLEQLLARGCVVKDLDKGLVDFYTMVDGEEAFLCWKLSEPKIAWWHPCDASYRDRRPLQL